MSTIGILGAISQEVNGIIERLTNVVEHTIGQRVYYQGQLNGQDVVVVYSRIGKVAAAATVATLILQFEVEKIAFIGVAGGIHDDVNVGDVVLASQLLQYDMNASPLRPQYEIPLLGKAYFQANENWTKQCAIEIERFLALPNLHQYIDSSELDKFAITQPKVHIGTIGSADLFVGTQEQKAKIQAALPELLCVEMEGAAVAQVCDEFNIPFIVIRTISDKANHVASFSFEAFIHVISSVYGQQIINPVLSTAHDE